MKNNDEKEMVHNIPKEEMDDYIMVHNIPTHAKKNSLPLGEIFKDEDEDKGV